MDNIEDNKTIINNQSLIENMSELQYARNDGRISGSDTTLLMLQHC